MNDRLTAYWQEWRPTIYRWIAAIVIFVLFAFVMEEYFDFFDRFR